MTTLKDERKTKKELINELQALRRRISWLEEKADSNISKKLAEKEKYYRLLLNSLHEDIMVIDREYRIVDMNNTFQSTTGQRREDVIGRYCYQVSHGYNRPCDMKGEECPLRTVFDTGETEHCVHQHTRQDGSKIWADLLFSPLKDEKGKVTHVIESARDITAHKEAEGTLSKSEERYRELVEKAGIAIMIDDLQGNFSYFNKQFCKLFGYREAEMRTKSIQTVVHPEDLERVESYHKGRLEGKKVPSRYEFKGIRKDGRTIYLEVEAVALKENGKVVGSRYYMWDITERKQAELALQVSEARFKTLFQEMPDAVFLSRIGGNNPGEILEVNPAAQLQTGYSGDELIGMNIVEDLSIDQNKVKLLPRREQSLDEGNSVRFTEKKRRKDGTEYWTEVLISKINFGDEQIALSVNRDITERIKAEEQIKQLQEYLQLQIDHMPIGLIVWDTEFRVQTWNPAAERIFGFTAEETLGRHPYDLIVPKEAQPLVENIWRRLIEGDTTAHSTNENVTKDRRTIICKWSNTPLKRNDGTVMGVLSMIQDITERKRAELELQESEERFRSVVENSHDGILIVDDTYTILYANRQLCSILGRSKKELLGHDFREFLDGETRRLVAESYRRRQLGERVPSRYEFPVIRKDGEERLVEMKVAVIQDAQGRANTIAHLLDITAARKGETALKESQQQFKTLFESAPDAYYLHDLDGVFLSANAAAENLTGYRREELIGKSFPESGLLSGEQIPGALEI
ncbi:MAG TPA: PAS domain S-box protein, partial [Caldithrix sp.]|nr:PAS domain S-box protein [Caldithrix sp.]